MHTLQADGKSRLGYVYN